GKSAIYLYIFTYPGCRILGQLVRQGNCGRVHRPLAMETQLARGELEMAHGNSGVDPLEVLDPREGPGKARQIAGRALEIEVPRSPGPDDTHGLAIRSGGSPTRHLKR